MSKAKSPSSHELAVKSREKSRLFVEDKEAAMEARCQKISALKALRSQVLEKPEKRKKRK